MKTLLDRMYVQVFLHPRPNHIDYRYLVTSRATSLTAFRHKASFKNWLRERGLTLQLLRRNRGITWGHSADFNIIGQYYEHLSFYDKEAFDRMDAPTTRVMSNARYTLGKILTEPDGTKTIVALNCNIKERIEFDYQESSLLFG